MPSTLHPKPPIPVSDLARTRLDSAPAASDPHEGLQPPGLGFRVQGSGLGFRVLAFPGEVWGSGLHGGFGVYGPRLWGL